MHILTILFLRMLVWCFLGSMTLHAATPEASQIFAKGVDNKITNVYHHKGPLTHEVVLKCPNQPIINHIPDAALQKLAGINSDSTKERYRFFMPLTTSVQKHIDTLNELGRGSKFYSITVRPTNQPMKGLEYIVEIDKNHVGFQVEIFESVTGDKAIAFKFLIRENLERINNKSHPLIRTAQAAVLGKKNFIS